MVFFFFLALSYPILNYPLSNISNTSPSLISFTYLQAFFWTDVWSHISITETIALNSLLRTKQTEGDSDVEVEDTAFGPALHMLLYLAECSTLFLHPCQHKYSHFELFPNLQKTSQYNFCSHLINLCSETGLSFQEPDWELWRTFRNLQIFIHL